MGEGQRWQCRRQWLLLWSLSLSTTHGTASETPSHSVGTAAQCSTTNLILERTPLKSEEQCPTPDPCYHTNDGTEFCIFTAPSPSPLTDENGSPGPLPILTETQQASNILDVPYSASSAAKYDGRSLLQKYDVRPVPGKGLGVVATTNFSRGDHILSDPPIIIVDHCAMAHVPQYQLARLFNGAAARLPPVQKDRMTGLAVFGDEAPDEWYLVGRIYATNAYMIDMDVGMTGCGVGALFPEGAWTDPGSMSMGADGCGV